MVEDIHRYIPLAPIEEEEDGESHKVVINLGGTDNVLKLCVAVYALTFENRSAIT